MSENGNTFIAFFTGLITGAFIGAVFALLFAPGAGDELRQKIQSGAQTSLEKAQIEMERLKQSGGSAPLESSVPDPSIATASE